MTTFTDEQASHDFQSLLDAARRQGEARIRTRDGREYAVRPVAPGASPFDIPGVDLRLSREEIVAFVREGRERHEP
jgi:antitoxin Phd